MKTIFFIHGMFQNDKSWDEWVKFFIPKGFKCVNEPWPYHEGTPRELRENIPLGLADLRLKTVADHYANMIQMQDTNAMLIGHSVGGLIVQKLINSGLGSAGICISSVAPNRMMTMDWSFFKNNLRITNPIKGDKPFLMTPEGFHANFCNTMSRRDSDAAYERTATHDSRNVLRDCLLEDGRVDLSRPHPPLLFIAAEKDQVVPAALNEKNMSAYKDENSLVMFKEFAGRGHFICGERGWEDVAGYCSTWMAQMQGMTRATAA